MTEAVAATAYIEEREGGFYVTLDGHPKEAGPYPTHDAAELAVADLVEAFLITLIGHNLTGEPK